MCIGARNAVRSQIDDVIRVAACHRYVRTTPRIGCKIEQRDVGQGRIIATLDGVGARTRRSAGGYTRRQLSPVRCWKRRVIGARGRVVFRHGRLGQNLRRPSPKLIVKIPVRPIGIYADTTRRCCQRERARCWRRCRRWLRHQRRPPHCESADLDALRDAHNPAHAPGYHKRGVCNFCRARRGRCGIPGPAQQPPCAVGAAPSVVGRALEAEAPCSARISAARAARRQRTRHGVGNHADARRSPVRT